MYGKCGFWQQIHLEFGTSLSQALHFCTVSTITTLQILNSDVVDIFQSKYAGSTESLGLKTDVSISKTFDKHFAHQVGSRFRILAKPQTVMGIGHSHGS